MLSFLNRIFNSKTDAAAPPPLFPSKPEEPVVLTPPEDVVRVFEFNAAGGNSGLLADGWSTLEQFGAWMIGRDSTLTIPGQAGPKTAILLLHLRPFLAGGALPGQRLSIGHGTDLLLPEALISQECDVTLALPPLSPGETMWRLQIRHEDAASPDAHGINADMRLLSFFLYSATLTMSWSPNSAADAVQVLAR